MWPEAEFFFDAFWRLSPSRQSGMGEGRIPFEAIDRFADRAGLASGLEFDRFERMIRAMDDEFLDRRKPKDKGEIANAVSTKDAGGVRDLLQRVFGGAEKGEMADQSK